MKGGGTAWNLDELLDFINRQGKTFLNTKYYIEDGKYYLTDSNYTDIPYEKRKTHQVDYIGNLVAANKSLKGGIRRKSTRKSTRRRGKKSRRTTRRKR